MTMQNSQSFPGSGQRNRLIIQLITIMAITLVALLIFRQLPGLDVFVSRLAFTVKDCPSDSVSVVCGNFLLAGDPVLNQIREISLGLPFLLGGGIVAHLVFHMFLFPRTTVEELQKISLVIWTLLLATIVLVNMILKELWGRPRPYQVEELGGDQPFVLPGTISNFCENNCSFVSGEASSAAWLITFLVFIPRRWQWPAGILIGLYVVFFSGLRVAFGRHFLSDVVISVLLTLCVIAALRYLFSLSFFVRVFDKIARWSNQRAYDLKNR